MPSIDPIRIAPKFGGVRYMIGNIGLNLES
jgi:hypothetical protein